MGKYIVGITGASGTIYAKRLIEMLLDNGHTVFLCITPAGKLVAETEAGWKLDRNASVDGTQKYLRGMFKCGENLYYYDTREIGAAIASGSFRADGMVIVPCSMGTLASISQGISSNLLERSADVILKERIPLVVVAREAPYNQIHLKNMLRLSECGGIIMPASPGFYMHPGTIDELVDFFVIRILDQLGVHIGIEDRWKGTDEIV